MFMSVNSMVYRLFNIKEAEFLRLVMVDVEPEVSSNILFYLFLI